MFTATEDTFVRLDSPNDSFGTSDFLLVGGHASVGPFNSFYKFSVDLTGFQTGETIDSVSFRLTSIAQAGSGTVNLNLYQLSAANSDWIQGTSGAADNDTNPAATFNNKAGQGLGATPWAGGNSNANFVAGTDYVDTVLGNYTGAANDGSGGQTFTFGNAALTSLLNSQIGNVVDLNFVLMDQTGDTNFLRIASSQNGTYAAPTLEVNVIPEPGTLILLGISLGALALFRRRS
ncbi:MAG: DNRLRE domain-containing protein [Kiritimatiellae bacterium]|nr:DNRLRE domain-containing protein [Kiritimatiellia bacterium]